MKSGSTNLGDIYRREVLPRGLRTYRGHYNGLYNRRYNSPEFLFHLPKAITKISSMSIYYKYLNLSALLAAYVLTLESRIAGAYISLVERMDGLGVESFSFRDDLSI